MSASRTRSEANGESNLDNNNWANGYVEVVDGVPNTSGVSQASRLPDLKKH